MEPLREHDGAGTDHTEHLISKLGPRTRVIVDDDGRIWTVEQLRAAPTDPIQKPSLLFTTDNLMRRIRHFPDDWHSLADAELYALSLKP
jgi:hypothetical protein